MLEVIEACQRLGHAAQLGVSGNVLDTLPFQPHFASVSQPFKKLASGSDSHVKPPGPARLGRDNARGYGITVGGERNEE